MQPLHVNDDRRDPVLLPVSRGVNGDLTDPEGSSCCAMPTPDLQRITQAAVRTYVDIDTNSARYDRHK
jgi:hypothetical protein